MIEPVVKLDFSQVKDAHGRLSRAAKDLRPVFRPGVRVLMKDLHEALKKREGPEGKHPKLSQATLAKRRAQRQSPRGKKWKRKLARGMLGKLWAPLEGLYGRQNLIVRSKVEWSLAQQDGASVGRGATIPARPFVYITAPFLDWALKKINEHIEKAWYQR